MSDIESDGPFLYLVPAGLRPVIDNALAAIGWEAHRAPFLDDDEPDALPMVALSPSDALMRSVSPLTTEAGTS